MAAKKENKVMSLAQAAKLVHDGDTIAMQGMGTQMSPLALVRELIRAGKRDLKVAMVVGGIGLDWMIAAGCVSRVLAIITNLDEFGMANAFRRAVEAGQVTVEEYSEHQILSRLSAAAYGLPFLVTRSGLGTELIDLHPETTKIIECPFTGQKVIACKALEPDVSILHAHRADQYGNVQFFPKPIWTDVDVFPRAAKKVIVTVEEIVENEEIRRTPVYTGIPYFKVDAVVEVPYGAHPCSLYPQYSFDRAFFEQYAAASGTAEGTQAFLDKYIFNPASHNDYLQQAGGAEALLRIRKWV
ncbi:MAG: CoA transferase subunit A [Acidobacteria bacterium]|nr:CoA transferase subunit A [Acidobacteriota bacterium]